MVDKKERVGKSANIITKSCIRLSDINEGDTIFVESIEAIDDAKQRLSSLGILKGKKIQMVKNDSINPIIIKVFDSKIALSRNQAQTIYICKEDK